MKATRFLLAGLLCLSLNAWADTLETVIFRADMATANESPAIAGVTASARAIIAAHIRRDNAGAIVSGFVDFDVDYNFATNDGTFSGLHIHSGAAGTNGPVTINTGLATAEGIAASGTGNVTRQATATSAAAIATLNGMLIDPSGYYVNMHTTAHAGGVVRAQLSRAETRVFRVTLDPANEVPAVVSDAKGTGSLIFLATRDAQGVINAGTVLFNTNYSFPSAVTLSGWHIHTGAAGSNGAVVINTGLAAGSPESPNVTTGALQRRVDVTTGAALDALRGIYTNPTAYYLNLHTTANPSGVMRGQLEPTVQNSYQVTMSPANEVPAIPGLDASALSMFTVYSSRNQAGTVTSATVIFDVSYAFPANTTFTGLHIHNGVAGANGGVVINTGIAGGANSLVDADGIGNVYRLVEAGSLTPAALTAVQGLLANPSGYYLNMHTTVNAGGAVRGQLAAAPAPPVISKNGIVNNASYNLAGTSVAPGSIAAVFGANLTSGASCLSTQGCNAKVEANRINPSMTGTTATVNGIPAPLLYTTPTQIGIQIPYEVSGTTGYVVVTADGQASAQETVAIDPAAPGIFSTTGDGRGAGAITHLNNTLVTAQNPATRGETLVLYATGFGATTPFLATGTFPALLTQSSTTPVVTVGGVAAEVVFGGVSGCCAGLNQVNFKVPPGAPAGATVPVVVSIGNKPSAPVTLVIQ